MKDVLGKIDSRMERQESMMQQLIHMVGKSSEKQEEIFQKVDRIEAAVTRIEENEPVDILAMFKQINGKLEERDSDLQVLNNRMFRQNQKLNA